MRHLLSKLLVLHLLVICLYSYPAYATVRYPGTLSQQVFELGGATVRLNSTLLKQAGLRRITLSNGRVSHTFDAPSTGRLSMSIVGSDYLLSSSVGSVDFLYKIDAKTFKPDRGSKAELQRIVDRISLPPIKITERLWPYFSASFNTVYGKTQQLQIFSQQAMIFLSTPVGASAQAMEMSGDAVKFDIKHNGRRWGHVTVRKNTPLPVSQSLPPGWPGVLALFKRPAISAKIVADHDARSQTVILSNKAAVSLLINASAVVKTIRTPIGRNIKIQPAEAGKVNLSIHFPSGRTEKAIQLDSYTLE